MSEDSTREEDTRKTLLNWAQRAIALRSKDREFHGLDREFLYLQAEMIADYNKSKDIHHPRDVGNAREVVLRKFLINGGYLPKRYSVSQKSARVASTTGHISNEIDILLYDPNDSVCLMNREDVYEVFPIESVYGVIQVKSRLNKKEIKDGLENLASYKKLDKIQDTSSGFTVSHPGQSDRGFGILFAYDSDLQWIEIIREIEAFAKGHPNRVWCNAICILSKGIILHGEDNSGIFKNQDIEKIQLLRMFGWPDRQNQCLFQFHSILNTLLQSTRIQPAEIDSYFRLPLIADTHSYDFCFGELAEFSTCQAHGDYQRKIGPDQLAKLIDWCSKAEPINWIRATDIAYGKNGNNTEAYERQPGDVRIYNPEKLPLGDILLKEIRMIGLNGEEFDTEAFDFDCIRCAGMTIYIPTYYSVKEGIISGCPKCKP